MSVNSENPLIKRLKIINNISPSWKVYLNASSEQIENYFSYYNFYWVKLKFLKLFVRDLIFN